MRPEIVKWIIVLKFLLEKTEKNISRGKMGIEFSLEKMALGLSLRKVEKELSLGLKDKKFTQKLMEQKQ